MECAQRWFDVVGDSDTMYVYTNACCAFLKFCEYCCSKHEFQISIELPRSPIAALDTPWPTSATHDNLVTLLLLVVSLSLKFHMARAWHKLLLNQVFSTVMTATSEPACATRVLRRTYRPGLSTIATNRCTMHNISAILHLVSL